MENRSREVVKHNEVKGQGANVSGSRSPQTDWGEGRSGEEWPWSQELKDRGYVQGTQEAHSRQREACKLAPQRSQERSSAGE